jgi:uncharacterized protein YegP (UPF0339 family)
MISLPEAKFEWYKDKAGKFRFRLVAPNRQIIALGEGYGTKSACIKSIESVKKIAPIAGILDLTSVEASKLRLEKARRFMQQKKPERCMLKVGQRLVLSQDLIAVKERDGKITLYEVVGE